MRISDWSSDVCPSDLRRPRRSSLKRLKSESCWKAFVLGAQRVMFAMADLMTRYGSQRVRSADALWTRSRSPSCRRTSDSSNYSFPWEATSEERPVGKACVSRVGIRWAPAPEQKHQV